MDGGAFTPSDRAERYLQVNYVTPFTTWEEAIRLDDAGDGSEWSAAHAKYHDYFRSLTELQDFEDVLLIDTTGNVVYSAYKGVDLGTNLLEGPYAYSNLAATYREVMGRNILAEVAFTDFAAYSPSLGSPAGWAVTPVARNAQVIGALAVELPIDKINEVLTVGQDSRVRPHS